MPNASRRQSLMFTMDNIDIPKPNLWHESFLKPITATAAAKLFALFVLVAVPLYAFFGKRRQRLIDGVPIVGMDKPGANIKELRERFRTDAKEMVLEGYRKVTSNVRYRELNQLTDLKSTKANFSMCPAQSASGLCYRQSIWKSLRISQPTRRIFHKHSLKCLTVSIRQSGPNRLYTLT